MPGGLLVEKVGRPGRKDLVLFWKRNSRAHLHNFYCYFTFWKILNDNMVITPYFYFLNLDISDISLPVVNGFIHVYIQNFYSDDLAYTVLKICNEFLSYKKPTIFIKMKKIYLNNCTYFFSVGFSASPKMI